MSKLNFDDLETRLHIVSLRHLLGVEVEDCSKNTFGNFIVRNFDETDLFAAKEGSLKLQYMSFIDDDGNDLHYLDYMKKYYPEQYIIAESQYVIYR